MCLLLFLLSHKSFKGTFVHDFLYVNRFFNVRTVNNNALVLAGALLPDTNKQTYWGSSLAWPWI